MQKLDSPKLGRPAILISENASNWLSCRTITPNLIRAYQLAFGKEQNIFLMDPANRDWNVNRLAQRIFASRPDRLIILDHVPHPHKLLMALALLYKNRVLPPIYIHVYGDFTLYAPEWLMLNSVLRRTRVTLICASDRQVQLLRQFIARPTRTTVIKCPFPVDTKFFSYQPALREKIRRDLNVDSDERICLYSGRISRQKNVLLLVKNYLAATHHSKIKSRLLIAGQFDDIGSPFFGPRPLPGAQYQLWTYLLRTLQPSERERVVYLGQFNSDDLLGLYNASDIGLSLSMHHDEDFGMSPIEGLCTGGRALLSDWGGYASFKDELGFCTTIPVQIPKNTNPAHAFFSPAQFREALERQLAAPVDSANRLMVSEHFQKQFSFQAIQNRITQIHEDFPTKFFRLQCKNETLCEPYHGQSRARCSCLSERNATW